MKQVLFVLLGLMLIFVGWLINDLNEHKYPKLDQCIKASVSQKMLCAKAEDYIRLNKISPYFLEAVVMSEDDKFYSHEGFDWREFKNSVLKNLRKLSFVRGGSTITQQLVKNVYLDHSKTILRKVREAYIAHQIEKKYSKDLILEKYVNTIQFGQDLWGVKEAANFYFGVQPRDLGVLESLYLVILLPSPVKYSRSYEKEEMTAYQKKRIRNLLKRLRRRGVVDPDYASFLLKDVDNFPWRGGLLKVE